VVIAARADELELAGLVVVPLGIAALEQEAFDLVRRVEHGAVLGEPLLGTDLSLARMSAMYSEPSFSRTSANTSTLPGPKTSDGSQYMAGQSMPSRRSDSACCEKPRIDDPSNVRLSADLRRNFLS
jgi:hypothetical protein